LRAKSGVQGSLARFTKTREAAIYSFKETLNSGLYLQIGRYEGCPIFYPLIRISFPELFDISDNHFIRTAATADADTIIVCLFKGVGNNSQKKDCKVSIIKSYAAFAKRFAVSSTIKGLQFSSPKKYTLFFSVLYFTRHPYFTATLFMIFEISSRLLYFFTILIAVILFLLSYDLLHPYFYFG
jgi:hypothetical protein